MSRPRVLIEEWLPVTELGIESRRERAAASALPPLSFLHVWWARRPLVASAATVLGSLMPVWSEALRSTFPDDVEISSDSAYKSWFLRLCGIHGDPIAARKAYDQAVESGIRIPNPYTYRQAFRNSPSLNDLRLLNAVLTVTWGQPVVVADPTAGGGSIPFEATRYGLRTWANDLNSVAVAILRAGVDLPARYGPDLVADLKSWGSVLTARMDERLQTYFPSGQDELVATYLFARTVACPRTGKPVPLSPNWWLVSGDPKVAVRLKVEQGGKELDECAFEIARGHEIDFDPDAGTVAGGNGISPWDGLAIDGEYIKNEAQAGRMGSQLYAVAVRNASGRGFRAPTAVDLAALTSAEEEERRIEGEWIATGVLPSEEVPSGNDDRPHHYGMGHWYKMFSPRQRLVHGTFVKEYLDLVTEVKQALPPDRATAVLALLALMQGKGLNYNAYMSSWHAPRETMRSVFERHDFAFKWTYAEFEGSRELYSWCLKQLIDAYEGIAGLLQPSDGALLSHPGARPNGLVTVTAGNAADLKEIADGSVTLVCMDPPYYANVMYAELADFFYVWEKRTLGVMYPDLFASDLTDKKNEAVANYARFADSGKRKKELATADYRAKMTAIFTECERILNPAGVLTVMFTHKEADAWDSLGTALMEAGFTIESSWPVNTESDNSLHQAKKNAAASTIMLVCRKRALGAGGNQVFFEDLEADVRASAREALARFAAAGIGGVDLLLATYGPALSIISAKWPVYSSEAEEATGRSRLLRPEEALDAARAEVVRIQRQRLVGTAAQLDPLTDFTLIAWDTFRAAEFPYDEARRLALATGGLDVEDLARARLLEKKSGTVVLLPPAKRLRRRDDELPGVHPEAKVFGNVIDAVHTAMYVADIDGLAAAKALMDRAGLTADTRFEACLQGLVNAIPRTKTKGTWVRPEAATLDRLSTAYFPDLQMPKDQAEAPEQPALPLDL